MKRPICIASIGWIIGLIGGYTKSIVLFYFFIFCFLVIRKTKNNLKRNKKLIDRSMKAILSTNICLLFIGSMIIANIYYNCIENRYKQIQKDLENREIEIKGIIVSDPKEKEYGKLYDLKVISIKGYENFVNFHLQLNVKNLNTILKYGDEIICKGTFEIGEKKRNYNGFDYNDYLKSQGIAGILRATGKEISIIRNKQEQILKQFASNIRDRIKRNLNNLLSDESAGIALGLLIGDKTGIKEEWQKDFKKANLSHMLAVSGAHVSYMIIGISYMLNKCKIGKRTVQFILILFLILFTYISGETPSITRACFSGVLSILASMLLRKSDIYNNLAISIFFLTIKNPFCLNDIGLQLSYAGTIGILIFFPVLQDMIEDISYKFKEKGIIIVKRKKGKLYKYIKDSILITVSANLPIIPIIIIHFHTVSFTFIITNLIVSPFFGIVLILGLILVLISIIYFPLSQIIAPVFEIFIKSFLKITTKVSLLPLSRVYIVRPLITTIFLYYFYLLQLYYKNNIKQKENPKKIERIMYKYLKKVLKILFIISISASIIFLYHQKKQDYLKIHFVDVGQGDCTVIRTRLGKTILIDGGGVEGKDIGEQTLLPYLLERRINEIDILIISHFDTDHVRTDC